MIGFMRAHALLLSLYPVAVHSKMAALAYAQQWAGLLLASARFAHVEVLENPDDLAPNPDLYEAAVLAVAEDTGATYWLSWRVADGVPDEPTPRVFGAVDCVGTSPIAAARGLLKEIAPRQAISARSA